LHGPTLARLLASLGPLRGQTFLDQLRMDLTSARDLLRDALANADLVGVQRAAHSLIALAGTVGAAALEQAARALNLNAQATAGKDPQDMADDVAALATRLIAELDAFSATGQPVEGPNP
jgi:HPt (histidine-containing phosphotransfer) domain-containing protein